MDREIDSLVASPARRLMSPRKNIIRRLNDDFARDRERWLKRAAFFHSEDLRYLSLLIQKDYGCWSLAAELAIYWPPSSPPSALV
jgi:hypothetical protein